MKTWLVAGTTVINVYAEIEAETLEEAIDIADNEISMVEYCDGNVGVNNWSAGEIQNVEVTENGYIDWSAELSEEA